MRFLGDAESRRYAPLRQLVLARLREFFREPEAIFWVYGFPLLMIVALGIAFRSRPIEQFKVDVQAGRAARPVAERLDENERFVVEMHDRAKSLARLRMGKTDLVVSVDQAASGERGNRRYHYHYDPAKPGSLVARAVVDDVLQRGAGRIDPVATRDVEHQEPGGRYIDFLVPGLLGMGLMGGGLWGVGFVIVDMRIRKLLKRFVATPMKKSQFLASLMLSRLVGMVPEVLLLLAFAWLVFGVVIHGGLLVVLLLILLGAFMFAGLGLLVASRAKTIETVSGLMNLVMLPMWVLSGIFFTRERFPDLAQPVIRLLPLTALIDALRAVMLEGLSIAALTFEVGVMVAWTVVSFSLALRWFRWT